MSIPHAILAMLSDAPRRASQVRADFESCTGGTWPLNMGQVATTLDRLVRDGLVAAGDEADGPQTYEITSAGARALRAWWSSPVQREVPSRDELTIKLAMAVAVPGVDVLAVVQLQRTETQRALHALTRLKRVSPPLEEVNELAWPLVLEKLIFAAEAELRWMDHVEERLGGALSPGSRAESGATDRSVQLPAEAIDG